MKHPRNYVSLGEVSLFSFAGNANTLIVFPRTISLLCDGCFYIGSPSRLLNVFFKGCSNLADIGVRYFYGILLNATTCKEADRVFELTSKNINVTLNAIG